MPNFIRSSTVYATSEPMYGANGKVFRQAAAHGSLTANKMYFIIYNEFGPITAALSDVADTVRFGMATGTASTGDIVWLQTGGPVEDVDLDISLSMSVGHAVLFHNGAFADAGADYTGSTSELAVATAVSTNSQTQDLYLVDRPILTTT